MVKIACYKIKGSNLTTTIVENFFSYNFALEMQAIETVHAKSSAPPFELHPHLFGHIRHSHNVCLIWEVPTIMYGLKYSTIMAVLK